MKIAHVVCTYPPYKGGMGRVAFEYTERLRQRGHSVHVFTPKDRTVADDPAYVHRLVSPIHIGNAGVMPSLFARLSGFDLIHLHYPFFGGAEPVIVRKAVRRDQGLVMTYHMDAVAGGVRGAVFSAHKRMLFPWIASRADRILVSSRAYADGSALASLPEIQDRIEIHPFGVDVARFHPGPSRTKERFGIPASVPVIVFVGGLDRAHHFKGVPVLIDAMKRVMKDDWRLLIVGDGDLRATYEAQATPLADKIRFVGALNDQELSDCFRAAAIHVFPSTERAEAFGLVSLEAAASGVPTIASDLPGVSSVVLDGETGLLVPPKDAEALANAVQTLLRDEGLRERFALSARKRAEADFAWEPLIAKLEDTYRDVLVHVRKI